ncbi:hypothetical protein FLM48_04335 [Shewanella sp. Scap07]|nr:MULTISPECIES: hypothetical protein [Shewanella]QLE87708.1 hypothetical protein FLM48_04335 [Shewanella sp. Scap07]
MFASGSKSTPLSVSCKSCDRLTVIEGESVCFKSGEIFRLTPLSQDLSQLNLLCDNWKIDDSKQ